MKKGFGKKWLLAATALVAFSANTAAAQAITVAASAVK